ncbi:MAG TPA: hypothetical protein PKA98_08275 [Acidimicrobiales bacterium]|nr:hypothetical protein [Acidimicrobiales bacterium]
MDDTEVGELRGRITPEPLNGIPQLGSAKDAIHRRQHLRHVQTGRGSTGAGGDHRYTSAAVNATWATPIRSAGGDRSPGRRARTTSFVQNGSFTKAMPRQHRAGGTGPCMRCRS